MMHSNSRLGVFIAGFWAFLAATGLGVEPKAGKPLLTQAFEKTKDAKQVEDFTAILELCGRAGEGQLSAKMSGYAPKLMAWAHNRRGEVYSLQAADSVADSQIEEAKRLDGLAFEDFDAAVKLDDSRWKPRHNRGVSYGLQGKYEAAITDFSAVVELKPDYADGWFNRAEMLLEAERYAEAAADYKQALELRPDDEAALLNRGLSLFRLGAWEEALSSYQQAIDRNDSSALGYARRGRIHEQKGDWAEAAADYRRAISLDSGSLAAYRNAAWLMATCPEPGIRDPQRAIQAAERAVELVPASPDWKTLDVVAAAYASSAQYQKAVELASQALRLAPTSQRKAITSRAELYRAAKPYRQSLVVAASHEQEVTR